MHHGLCGRERVQVSVCRDLLRGCDVVARPSKEEPQRAVDYGSKYRRIEDTLPHDCRREDGSTPKEEIKQSWTDYNKEISQRFMLRRRKNVRSFHETVDDRRRQSRRAHRRSERNKHVHFGVQSRANAKGGESLSCTLTKSNITQAFLPGDFQNIFNAVGNIISRKLVDAEVPVRIC